MDGAVEGCEARGVGGAAGGEVIFVSDFKVRDVVRCWMTVGGAESTPGAGCGSEEKLELVKGVCDVGG